MTFFSYSDSSGRRFQLCCSSTNKDISLAFLIAALDCVCVMHMFTRHSTTHVILRRYRNAYTRYELRHNLGSVPFECFSDVNWRK
jgi:hypothetical protein